MCEINLYINHFLYYIQLYKRNGIRMRNCLSEMIGIVLVKLIDNHKTNSLEKVDNRNEYY